MKILIIGATGTIGGSVAREFASRNEIISASRNGADIQVDISSVDSIRAMYEKVGLVDAVISATGGAYFGPLPELTPENNEISIQNKLKGQINVVLLGLNHVNDRGSFTLTTGIMMDDPVVGGASGAMANGGITAFVKSAAIEMPRGIRINSVSPNLLVESVEKYSKFFPGFEPVSAYRVAQAFRKSVEGAQTGQNYTVY